MSSSRSSTSPKSSLKEPRTSATGSRLSRRPSGVRFQTSSQPLNTGAPHTMPAQVQEADIPPAHLPSSKYTDSRDPQWQFPVYHNNYPRDYSPNEDDNSHAPRRGSDGSDKTLHDSEGDGPIKDMTYSSYRHPYDIVPPPPAHGTSIPRPPNKGHEYLPGADIINYDEEMAKNAPQPGERRPGLLGNLLQLYQLETRDEWDEGEMPLEAFRRRQLVPRPWGTRRIDSLASEEDQVIDPDDPLITGQRKVKLDDPENVEKSVLREMNYKTRRKERRRIRIQYNITSVHNRQLFLMKLARALMVFGAPSHRIESQLLSAARILEVDAEFIQIPGVIICSFGDFETKTTDTHFVKCTGRLSLGYLHEVHQIYRKVVHDELSAKKATDDLQHLLNSPPIYPPWIRCLLAFCISALICPLAFGGSFADMWFAGVGAVILCLMHIGTANKSVIYQNVFEVSVTTVISFMARGLSTAPGQLFCYTAISSAGIVSILPGYLILTSSLELASKNIVSGSIKMVYALIYTLFLAFGLQVGSDLFLLVDHNARDDLTTSVSSNVRNPFTFSGKFWSDGSTRLGNMTEFFPPQSYVFFTFTDVVRVQHEHVHLGCLRPPTFPWYLRPFPWWSQFLIVPAFSVLSSLSNLQPFLSVDLIVMVVISCASYATNKIANHFIFARSDIVSAIGAFVVGLLGNLYSRNMGGTAFTVMVTGVLFLVPSGLSQAGGITAQGDGIEIGGAMVAVTIGITVGLFMSQTIVYMWGSRKNAAIFSF